MGIYLVFNEIGVIEPGLHKCTIDEFYRIFVEDFPSSQTRKDIFNSFCTFIAFISENFEICEIWADGSFVTKKMNPNDIDILIFFDLASYLKIISIWDQLRKYTNIDAYCHVTISEEDKKSLSSQDIQGIINQRNYWRGQFGFDRADNPKGIIVFAKNDINNYLEGGDSDVDAGN